MEMSFLIENILKKDNGETKQKYRSDETNLTSDSSDVKLSILQQTLLNRSYYYSYYKPISDYGDKFEGRIHWNDFESRYSSQHYCGTCADDGMQFTSVYPRNRLWSIYNCTTPVLHLQHSQYSKRKGGQVRFTTTQTDVLEKRFTSHKYLSPEDRKVLADSLELTDRQVKTWFQNRRAKWRRSNSSSDSTGDNITKEEHDIREATSWDNQNEKQIT